MFAQTLIRRFIITLVATFVILLMLPDTIIHSAEQKRIIYVDVHNQSTFYDGNSWATAYPNLADALLTATNEDEIWVAEGVYKPGDYVTSTFNLVNSVAIYGGFAATETLRSQRNWQTHVTILSGDVDSNDWNTDTNYIAETWHNIRGTNAQHIITSNNVTETVTVDGFVITAGQATIGEHCPELCGGGVFVGYKSSLHCINTTFSGNQASFGAGLYNYGSTVTLTEVIFVGNRAYDNGGGMRNYAGNANMRNVKFENNQANEGGGIHNRNSRTVLENVVFGENYAFSGGGIFNNIENRAILINTTFSGNQTHNGGSLYSDGGSYTLLINSILWGNQASIGEPEIFDTGNSISTIKYSLIAGGCPSTATCEHILSNDPRFIPATSVTFMPQSGSSYHLQASSPAINAGNNISVTLPVDLDGNSRIVGDSVDMGAYEFQGVPIWRIYLPVLFCNGN